MSQSKRAPRPWVRFSIFTSICDAHTSCSFTSLLCRNFNLAAKKAEAAAKAETGEVKKVCSLRYVFNAYIDYVSAQTIARGKAKQSEKASKKSRTEVTKQRSTAVSNSMKSKTSAKSAAATNTDAVPKPKPVPAPKPKLLPQVHWKRVPVPASFTYNTALTRMAIREFVLRFSEQLDIPRSNIEELEEIGGSSDSRRRALLDDDEEQSIMTEQECEVVLGWVSEVCVKSIIVGLLNLIAENESVVGSREGKRHVGTAAKQANACGANLSRLWNVLANLRTSLRTLADPADNVDLLDFPDPLPPPPTATAYSTRSGKLDGAGGVHVASSAQLIYIVERLVECAIESTVLREEMAKVDMELKELGKQDRERTKEEKEMWEEAKKKAVRLFTLFCSLTALSDLSVLTYQISF